MSNFGKDIITDFQVGVDNARLFLNNSDLISEDLSYSSGTKIDIGDASVTFNWTKINDFDFNLLSSEFVSSVQEVRVLSNGLENLAEQISTRRL